MKVGVVGCGAVGLSHAAGYKNAGCEVVAVVDTDEGRAMAASRDIQCRYYLSFIEMMDREKPEIVSVCTPSGVHRPVVEAAAARAAMVVCEKPLATNLEDAIAIGSTILSTGTPFAFGFKMRYESVLQEAMKIVQDGEIGQLRHLSVVHFQPPPAVRWYMDNGVLMELLVHALDLCNWFLDDMPQSIYMRCGRELGGTGEDRVSMVLDYGGMREATVAGGYLDGFPPIAGRRDMAMILIGTQGTLVLNRSGSITVESRKRSQSYSVAFKDPFSAEIADFVESFESKRRPATSMREALAAQVSLAAAYASTQSGTPEPVQVVPTLEACLGRWGKSTKSPLRHVQDIHTGDVRV